MGPLPQCVEMLLDAGCDAAAVSETGGTGLVLAAGCGHAALLRAQVLAGGGGPLEACSEHGATAAALPCPARGGGHAACVVRVLLGTGCNTRRRLCAKSARRG